MPEAASVPFNVLIIVLPNFNLAATTGFIDPFRAANYLDGQAHCRWMVASPDGGPVIASNGIRIDTQALSAVQVQTFEMLIVSCSWTPEAYDSPMLRAVLRRGSRQGAVLGGIDTGAFILAKLKHLQGRRATVHYEHLDAFAEMYPDVDVCDDLFVLDGDRISCSGGEAAVDLALHLISRIRGKNLANRAARYLFHASVRPPGARQSPSATEPIGSSVPSSIRKAIRVMEEHLESALPIPQICHAVGLSQRQLTRLFLRFVRQSPALYYRAIRLDRARGLVTQTEMPLSEVAVASGFANQGHFSRAYRGRFGIPPYRDRTEGRIPFEFRAWPLHQPKSAVLSKKGKPIRAAKNGKKTANKV